MAYSTASPPVLIAQGVGSAVGATGKGRLWFYSNTDATTAVDAAGYITNGYALGMRKGDLVLYSKTDASPISLQLMIVSASTTTSTDLSDGTAVTATNSD